MNAQLTSFTSLEHYEAELGGSITPMIADKFEALDEASADLLQVRVCTLLFWLFLAIHPLYHTIPYVLLFGVEERQEWW